MAKTRRMCLMGRLARWMANAVVVGGFGLLLAAVMAWAKDMGIVPFLMAAGGLLAFSGLAFCLAYLFRAPDPEEVQE